MLPVRKSGLCVVIEPAAVTVQAQTRLPSCLLLSQNTVRAPESVLSFPWDLRPLQKTMIEGDQNHDRRINFSTSDCQLSSIPRSCQHDPEVPSPQASHHGLESRHWTQEDVGFPLPHIAPRNFQWLAIAFLKGATLLQPAF